MSDDQISTLTINGNTRNPNDGIIERGSVSIHSTIVSDVNFVAELAKFDVLLAAIDAVQIGTIFQRKFAGLVSLIADPDVAAANSLAQREKLWTVKMRESVSFHPRRFTIPCADLNLLETNQENMDSTLPVFTTLVAAIENFVSYEGNPVTVSDIFFKGKNS